MILYYFSIAHVAQNTGNKTVCDFFRDVYACICMCTYFTFFLFTGLISLAKKKKKKTPAVKFLELIFIFRNNFFIFNFSKMCSR